MCIFFEFFCGVDEIGIFVFDFIVDEFVLIGEYWFDVLLVVVVEYILVCWGWFGFLWLVSIEWFLDMVWWVSDFLLV